MFALDTPAELLGVSASELVGIISDSAAEESRLIAQRLTAIAELLGRRVNDVYDEDPDPGYMLVTGFQRTSAEVAAAMNLSAAAAAVLVSQADALNERLPKLRALLSEGRINWYTLQLVISRTEYVRGSVVADLDTELAERILNWHCWSRQRIINAVDSIVRTLDPDAIAERERAADRRRIRVNPLGDGNAKIDAIVSAEAGAAFDQRLDEIAKSVCPQDPRTIDERRDGALAALAEGRPLPCTCGCVDCPALASAEQPTSSRIVINVIADRSTVLETGTAPGYLSGYGVIDADQVRELAERATLRLVDEPEVTRAEAMRYQPSAALERWIRCRDLTCRFPGCGRPAEVCDIDHTVPFNHADPESGGLTVTWNLKCPVPSTSSGQDLRRRLA
jgi:hypothetical protein